MDMVMATVKLTALVASSVGYIGYGCRTIGISLPPCVEQCQPKSSCENMTRLVKWTTAAPSVLISWIGGSRSLVSGDDTGRGTGCGSLSRFGHGYHNVDSP